MYKRQVQILGELAAREAAVAHARATGRLPEAEQGVVAEQLLDAIGALQSGVLDLERQVADAAAKYMEEAQYGFEARLEGFGDARTALEVQLAEERMLLAVAVAKWGQWGLTAPRAVLEQDLDPAKLRALPLAALQPRADPGCLLYTSPSPRD